MMHAEGVTFVTLVASAATHTHPANPGQVPGAARAELSPCDTAPAQARVRCGSSRPCSAFAPGRALRDGGGLWVSGPLPGRARRGCVCGRGGSLSPLARPHRGVGWGGGSPLPRAPRRGGVGGPCCPGRAPWRDRSHPAGPYGGVWGAHLWEEAASHGSPHPWCARLSQSQPELSKRTGAHSQSNARHLPISHPPPITPLRGGTAVPTP